MVWASSTYHWASSLSVVRSDFPVDHHFRLYGILVAHLLRYRLGPLNSSRTVSTRPAGPPGGPAGAAWSAPAPSARAAGIGLGCMAGMASSARAPVVQTSPNDNRAGRYARMAH